MTDWYPVWIDAALPSAARPQAVSALLRDFRDLDAGRRGLSGSLFAGAEDLAGSRVRRAIPRPG